LDNSTRTSAHNGLTGALSFCGARLLKAADYYFSTAGSDANGVGSKLSPWASLDKANTLDLQPGDRILLQGVKFSGTLSLTAEDGGTAANPVRVSSYGSGRATIAAGANSGISVYNVSGIAISNLIISGTLAGNSASGVVMYTDLPGATKLDYLRLFNLDISGFGQSGVTLGAWPSDGSKSGFRDVQITHVKAFGNADAGIKTYGYFSKSATSWSHENVYIGHCTTNDNKASPSKAATAEWHCAGGRQCRHNRTLRFF
jgi:hypothetical protein